MNNWIDVKEQKPEKWKRILLYSQQEGVNIGVLTDTGWGLDKHYVSDMGHSGYELVRHKSVYTHWMPLPEISNERK